MEDGTTSAVRPGYVPIWAAHPGSTTISLLAPTGTLFPDGVLLAVVAIEKSEGALDRLLANIREQSAALPDALAVEFSRQAKQSKTLLAKLGHHTQPNRE